MGTGVEVTCTLDGVRNVRPSWLRRLFRRAEAAGLRAVVIALALSFVAVSNARAQSEDRVKAAFLFNFARYVEWPLGAFDDAKAPITICMIGDSAFAKVVATTVTGKSVGPRPVQVIKTSKLSASTCHILYVDEDIEDSRNLLVDLADKSVFTVSDRKGFAHDGGIANFFRADKKIRFEINPTAAKESGLKISSRLLRLAKIVK